MPLLDQDLLTRLRAAMKDPTSRQIILQEMQNAQGDPLGNALSKLGTAMSTARTPGGAAASGLGGALGLGLGMLLRHRRQGQRGSMTGRSSEAPSTSPVSPSPVEENLSRPAGSEDRPTTSSLTATPTPPAPLATDTTSTPIVGGSRYLTGSDERGNPVYSLNGGQTWQRENQFDRTPVTGQIYNQNTVGTLGGSSPQVPQALSYAPYNQILAGAGFRRGGRIRQFAGGGHAADDALPLPSKPSEGRGILRRAPIPVISTTIVIAHHKPKPTGKKAPPKKPVKKKTGGPVQPPLKPAALPPKKGPGDGGPPAPYRKGGHVQVPRGSGIAQRGKAFRGIF